MNSTQPSFRAPSAVERVFNRAFGFVVGLGLGFSYNYLLQVRGRKSGKIYSTPIDLLERGGKRFLVAPRGRTQWVRNAEVAGEVTLKKGSNGTGPATSSLRSGEAGNLESLSGPVQARGAKVLSRAGWVAGGGFS